MAPFEAAGESARWRIVYDLLVKAKTGETVTYEAMGEALDLDPDEDRHAIQMAVRRAAREHEVMDNRALDAVPNEGYRVVEAAAHMELAQRHQRKGQRSTLRALSKVEHVDLTGLDVAARRAFEVVAIAFKLQADINRKLDIRQKTLERQVSAAMSAQDRTSDEVADLRARLEKLEAEREPGA